MLYNNINNNIIIVKNVINNSVVDDTIRALKMLKEPYVITILGNVFGTSYSPDLHNNVLTLYILRKLTYKDNVILEQILTDDNEFNDILTSVEFKKGSEPLDWPLIAKG